MHFAIVQINPDMMTCGIFVDVQRGHRVKLKMVFQHLNDQVELILRRDNPTLLLVVSVKFPFATQRGSLCEYRIKIGGLIEFGLEVLEISASRNVKFIPAVGID